MTDNLITKIFGTPISTYTDDDAVIDGILIPFILYERDTGHRVTSPAWHELTTYHKAHGYPDYTDQAFYRFFMAELLPLVPAAHHEWNYGDILKTDYLFNTQCRSDGVLWH